MEIFVLYQSFLYTILNLFKGVTIKEALIFSLLTAVGIWAVLFVLQGIGLYVMAKRRNFKKCALAFVPFANIWLMGKLAGTCDVFGHPVKRAGLYTMILQIVVTVLSVLCIFAEFYLYLEHGLPQIDEQFNIAYWGLTGFPGVVEKFYEISTFIYAIPQLMYTIFMFILLVGLLRQYSPKNYSALTFLYFLIPEVRFISIFALRNKKAIDYQAYMRARREAYIRQQQQYHNPYNTPYGYGGNYHNPYNTEYARGESRQNGEGQPTPPPPEEPFGEFGNLGKDTDKEKQENVKHREDIFFD